MVVATEDLSDGTEVTLLIVRNGILQDLDSTEDPQEAQRISQAMEAFDYYVAFQSTRQQSLC